MRVERIEDFRAEIVVDWLDACLGEDLHLKRIKSLGDAVFGAVKANSLAVSCIGLALAEGRGLKARHATKQVDRLLSNEGIDLAKLFTPWIVEAVGLAPSLEVAMDWTDFDADDQSTLMLSLITGQGRSIPLLWLTVYKAELKGRRSEFEDALLCRLKEALPEGRRVTIVADRGFADVRLMTFLAELGFAYVIRFRGDTAVASAEGPTRKAEEWVGSGGRAKKLVAPELTGRKVKVGATVHVRAKDMKESWHLAASDAALTSRQIIDAYARRWSIETTFRDAKDIRFGMGLAELRIADPARRDRLLFVCSLASKLLTMLGQAGESLGMDKSLRTSTTKRRVHSLFRQGCMLFQLMRNMRETDLVPLLLKFGEMINEDKLLVAAFGLP